MKTTTAAYETATTQMTMSGPTEIKLVAPVPTIATSVLAIVEHFDLECLKADFLPLPPPPPLVLSNGAYEMTHATASATMPVSATQQLVHRCNGMMNVEAWHRLDALTSSKAILATNGTHGLDADDNPFSSVGRLSTPTNNATVREPIRRESGGCFSGPNCLVYFDSRVVMNQSKVLHTS
ncbi:hypothetical protein H310_15282 [Aphanomyces invadans]|uniref:Uncharacterized protein n=1 Tax=Aphanomyces invadans TaxID=157072 RepID=A0A024T7P5_9STRA|nr:hypothetical protein H310_15282 [Aphanomyces invadans]ETV89878.1 hypothetical protein H310_15282 [Aphanomyces invadans]|eukprot:XP_008881489.1 hypothetical protein H310_15282 [Aphanomyces invadans]